jgi:hypothetical protein
MNLLPDTWIEKAQPSMLSLLRLKRVCLLSFFLEDDHLPLFYQIFHELFSVGRNLIGLAC